MNANHHHLDRRSTNGILQEDPSRISASLKLAIRVVDLSLTMLSEAAGDRAKKTEPEDATPRKFFEAAKWDALELADGIYWSASEVARLKDDRDLERFEKTGSLAHDASARTQGLVLLTLAKELAESPFVDD